MTKDGSSVSLSILYDEYFNTFSINSMFKTTRDSVYVFKETNTVVEKKPKFIGLTSGLRVDFQDEVKDVGIDVGAQFAGKYSVSLGFDTRKTASVRFGIDFEPPPDKEYGYGCNGHAHFCYQTQPEAICGTFCPS